MEYTDKFVRFDLYCKTCKHKDEDDGYDPCDTCLATPTNLYSRKPINYEEKKSYD